MTAALYHALIVEHDRAPRNHGPLAGATHEATRDNPLCGDVVTIRLVLDGDRVRAIAFEARGCALCRAAGSLLTEHVAGARVADARVLVARFERFIAGEDASELGDLVAFRGVQTVRARRACALLPFRALASLLER